MIDVLEETTFQDLLAAGVNIVGTTFKLDPDKPDILTALSLENSNGRVYVVAKYDNTSLSRWLSEIGVMTDYKIYVISRKKP